MSNPHSEVTTPTARGLSRRRFGGIAAAGLAAGAAVTAFAVGTPAGAHTAADYYDQARETAGDDPVLLALSASLTPGFSPPRPAAPQPVKIFDDLAVLCVGSVSALAILTDDGIIMIDSLNTAAEARRVIAGGLTALGADPADIKYVVVTHGHRDHFGGAQYLADTYGARVLMAPADWTLVSGMSGAPARDMNITDGQRLTLGGTEVRLHYTPGHTAGTVSPVFPVTWRGTTETAMTWGGSNPPANLAGLRTYLASIQSFTAKAQAANVSVEVSAHPFVDYGLERIRQLQNGAASNPFVLGEAGIEAYLAVMEAMLNGRIAEASGTSTAAAECC
ncbi:MBL fold metallo-hydrolase [Glycomyces sp. NPDC048151]|uniref:MBL fold metallo-hydrolase n=1 Tax=Glycomyces sp. NPDC048151 TaxID=3364002 RepID=UPI00371EFBCD